MRVGTKRGDISDRKTFLYTMAMDKMGIIGFERKLDQITRGKAKWEIDMANAAEANRDDDYKKYKACWQEKWDLVKETICG